MNQRIASPSVRLSVSYTSARLTRLWATAIITGSNGKALSDKDFADHLQPLAPLAYASYIEGHAIKPVAHNPNGHEEFAVFLNELPAEATSVVVVGYILDDEVNKVGLEDIQKLTVAIEQLEGDCKEVYMPLHLSNERPPTSHLSKILCEMRRTDDGAWELRPVNRSVSSNEVFNRQYGILLDL